MKVVWSQNALNDLREIKAWISRDSVCYALRVVEGIVDLAESLADMPRRGHSVQEAINDSIREIHSESYRIIYKVSERSVAILTIVHMARSLAVLPDDEEA